MKSENATLKDIAEALGVSTTTVHRALQGKDRVSEETRAKVLHLAAEMGYRSNYMAASLKRRKMRIAIAFPEPSLENRYYYLSLWQGARSFLETVAEFNTEVLEFSYPLSPNGNGTVLKELYDQYADEIDGIVTVAVEHSQTAYFMEKLAEKEVPVVLVGGDLYKHSRYCCVKCYDETAGRLAGELLTAFHPAGLTGKVIITGNLISEVAMADQYDNSRGFESYLEEHAPDITLLSAYNPDTRTTLEMIKALLVRHKDIYAVYSCSARHTVQMCKAVVDLGMQGQVKLIGNDCFPESVDFLKKGVLTAIIDKKIARQSFLATQALFNRVVKSEYASGSTLYVRPSVVMRSNVDAENS